jgi:hypothetical protein
MAVISGDTPSKESWYIDCATTSHICGDRQKFVRYKQYAKREKREIRDFAGRVAGKAIGYGDVRLRLRLPEGHRNEVVVRNVLHVDRAHNSLSQSQVIIRGYRLSQSTAIKSRYTTNRRQRIVLEVEVEEVLWAWHARLEGYSSWM